MKTKNPGITLLIAMGTSLLVLALAFATLNSVSQSLEQANSIQRSTQLFFAAESGLEAAFFHHNARGAGASFTLTDETQTLDHETTGIETVWSLEGRATDPIGSNYFYADILAENQSVQIPLAWDSGTNITGDPENPPTGSIGSTEDMTISFYRQIRTAGAASSLTPSTEEIRDKFETLYNDFSIPGGFDFGNPDEEVLIDWSVSRKNDAVGVETFIPSENEDCATPSPSINGFICESQLAALGNGSLDIDTSQPILGRILPGLATTTLDNFWDCNDAGGGNCSDFRVSMRPLLGFTDSVDSSKIIGIPYSIATNGGSRFPLPNYVVNTDVTQENFSQAVQLEIPEKTSIGVFDYVIFD